MTTTDLSRLRTEQSNPASAELDRLSALDIARVINAEDAKVASAVARAVPQIARAIDAVADALRRGGRLIYVGAGTSGRIAVLDAAECPPTFNTDPRMVQYVIAGGEKALGAAVEANEDSRELGVRDLMRKRPAKNDVVIGIAASGRTPYTLAAVEYERSRGARTIAVVCNPHSPLEKAAHVAIVAEVGPEVLTGSTRLKAGSAEKMVLNMITTGAMARLGYVYDNLMVNLHTKNEKLFERGLSILQRAAGVDRESARRALQVSDMNVPVALVMLKGGVTRREAQRRLRRAGGHVRHAIAGMAAPEYRPGRRPDNFR
jgi:N-acetylmuramic acid 6-phosphate etherase